MTNKLVLIFAILFLSLAVSHATAANLDCETLSPLMAGFLNQHLTYKKFTPQLEEHTVTQFIKILDPSKLYLMDSDVEQIRSSMSGLFSKLDAKKADCASIDAAQKLYEQRVK